MALTSFETRVNNINIIAADILINVDAEKPLVHFTVLHDAEKYCTTRVRIVFT